MDDLVIGLFDFGLRNEIFQHMAVFNFGYAEHCVPCPVVFLHGADHGRHVMEFLGIFCLGPLVLSVGQILVVVLALVVDSVEKVLEVVESYHVAAVLRRIRPERGRDQQDCNQDVNVSFHFSGYCFWLSFGPGAIGFDFVSQFGAYGGRKIHEQVIAEFLLEGVD